MRSQAYFYGDYTGTLLWPLAIVYVITALFPFLRIIKIIVGDKELGCVGNMEVMGMIRSNYILS